MPRCMMNSVRGYREKKYWGCEADSQNVMKTRSGRVISTIPKLRPSTSAYRQTSVASSSAPNLTDKSKDPYKNPPVMDYKPMSCLSFVTRFGLIKDGIPLNFTSDLVCNGDWTDHKVSSILQQNPRFSNGSPIELEELAPTRREDEVMDVVQHSLQSEEKASMKTEKKQEEKVPAKVNLIQRKKEDRLLRPNQECITNSANDITYIYISTSKESSSNMGAVATTAKLSEKNKEEGIKTNSSKPSLAERHPVLFRYISRDDPKNEANMDPKNKANMASMVLPLADTQTPKAAKSVQVLANNKLVTPGTTTHLIMYKTIPTSASPQKNTPTSPKIKGQSEDVRSESTDISTEEDDDNSSVTSQSSSDELYVQRASEIDATFQRDLSRFQMESHAYTLDAGGNQIHRCMICDKVFTVLAAFLAHVNTHVRPKNRCGVCGKIFSRSWLLKGHIRTHTGERPYTCKYAGCDRRFADKSNLRSHMLIHTTKEKSYICSKCKRAFAQKRYLHKHKLEVCKI